MVIRLIVNSVRAANRFSCKPRSKKTDNIRNRTSTAPVTSSSMIQRHQHRAVFRPQPARRTHIITHLKHVGRLLLKKTWLLQSFCWFRLTDQYIFSSLKHFRNFFLSHIIYLHIITK